MRCSADHEFDFSEGDAASMTDACSRGAGMAEVDFGGLNGDLCSSGA